MAWWDDVANAVSSVVDATADVVEGVVNEVADVVADLVETVGNLVQDGLDAVGGLLGSIPLVGGFLRGAFAWVGSIVAGLTNLAGAVVKGVLGIIGGVLAGLIRILGGLLVLNFNLMLKGLVDIGSSMAGAIILIVGEAVSLVQRVLFCQSNERPLTKKERDMLRRVFFNSLALYNIRIIQGWAGLFNLGDAPFTLGNTIYMQSVDPAVAPSVLVHECVHVWQYQNVGARYTMDALGARGIYGPTAAYNWEAELARGNVRWWDFNKEAAAQFMQDVWNLGSLTALGVLRGPGDGAFYELEQVLAGFGPGSATAQFTSSSGSDHSAFATESIAVLRGRINARWSHAF